MPLREMRPLGVPFPEPRRRAEEEEKVPKEAGSSPLARPGLVCLRSLRVETRTAWLPACV